MSPLRSISPMFLLAFIIIFSGCGFDNKKQKDIIQPDLEIAWSVAEDHVEKIRSIGGSGGWEGDWRFNDLEPGSPIPAFSDSDKKIDFYVFTPTCQGKPCGYLVVDVRKREPKLFQFSENDVMPVTPNSNETLYILDHFSWFAVDVEKQTVRGVDQKQISWNDFSNIIK